MAASFAASKNERNERAGKPRSSWVRSEKATRPSMSVITWAHAPDWTECPDVYSGNGGVTSRLLHAGSIRFWMYVMGRSRLYRYFAFQQAMNASLTASPVRTYASAATSSDAPSCLSTCVVTDTEWPGGVDVAPGSSDQ